MGLDIIAIKNIKEYQKQANAAEQAENKLIDEAGPDDVIAWASIDYPKAVLSFSIPYSGFHNLRLNMGNAFGIKYHQELPESSEDGFWQELIDTDAPECFKHFFLHEDNEGKYSKTDIKNLAQLLKGVPSINEMYGNPNYARFRKFVLDSADKDLEWLFE